MSRTPRSGPAGPGPQATAERPARAARTTAVGPGDPARQTLPEAVGWLQSAAGNRAVERLLTGAGSVMPAGEPLDAATRDLMEPWIGSDLGHVRVHTGAGAARSAAGLGALAYSIGQHVVFGRDRYQPGSPSGAALLAHELTHVRQGANRPPALRRKPDPTRLDVTVPDPATLDDFVPEHDFAWQNPLVAASVFPTRNSAFREFLIRARTEDLTAEMTTGYSGELAAEVGGQILEERARVTGLLAEHARLRKAAEAELRTAHARTLQHLAEPQVREQTEHRRALQAHQKLLTGQVAAQQARVAELDALGTKISAGQQRELDRRHAILADLTPDLETTTGSLEEVTRTLAEGSAPFTGPETVLQTTITEHSGQEKPLRSRLAAVTGGVDAKGRASSAAVQKWRLAEYSELLDGMGHDELLGQVLDLFDADPGFTRYSKAERYLVIHLSGMRYASTSGSWGPPQALLAVLKQQEIDERFAGGDAEAVEQEAQATQDAVQAELDDPKTPAARRAEQRPVAKRLGAPAAARAALFAKKPQDGETFDALETATRDRADAIGRGDTAAAVNLAGQIADLAKQLGGTPRVTAIRTTIAAAQRQRLQAAHDAAVRDARRELSGLSDLQALSVLQAMKDSVPGWVWHEVVRRTQLRVNVSDPGWNTPSKELDPKQDKDPVDARWRGILQRWSSEPNPLDTRRGHEFQVVATAVVCNQLAETAQAVRGNTITQGIGGAAGWYRKQAADAAAKGGPPAQRPFFIRPTKASDFVPWSGIFWAHFESDQGKASGNMAHPLAGLDYLTEGKQVIRDGLVEGEWTYHLDAASGDITRTKGPAGAQQQLQWFSWQHEATVIEQAGSAVTTFETSRGARFHSWTLTSLVDPTKEKWVRDLHDGVNVFLGWAPESADRPNVGPALKDILPGRDAD